MLGARLLKGSPIIHELQLGYYFTQGLEPYMRAEIINKKLLPLDANIEAAWEFYRKPRAPPKAIVMVGAAGATASVPAASMDLDALRYGNSPFGGMAAFDPSPAASHDTRGLSRGSIAAISASSAGGYLEADGNWGETTSSQFLGAVADQRELLFRERSPGELTKTRVAADLNTARRSPSPGQTRPLKKDMERKENN